MTLPRQSRGAIRPMGIRRASATFGISPSNCNYNCHHWDFGCKAREAACRARCPACRVACRSAQAAAVGACADLSGPAFLACEAAAIEAGNQCYNGCC